MKRYLLLILALIPIFIAPVSCDKTNSLSDPLSLEEAIERTKKDWDQFDVAWAWKDPVPANSQMKIFLGSGKEYEVSPNFEAWLIVVDTNPLLNGGIHYRWIFVSISNGEIQTLNTTSGPYEDLSVDDYYNKVMALKNKMPYYSSTQTKAVSSGLTTRSLHSSTNDWAVIISGGVNQHKNFERYGNDCSWIYSTLRQQYGYKKDHIFCLISDGTDPANDRELIDGTPASSPLDLDKDGIDDVQYSASLVTLRVVFLILGSVVQSGDNVFIYVVDHGGHDGTSSFIALWNGEKLYPSVFASLVNRITPNAKIHFVLGECNSGGFVSALSGTNRSIVTSCAEYQNTNAHSSGLYDEFVFHWTNAMAGWNPITLDSVNADDNQDGHISFQEAFNFARDNDYFYNYSNYVSDPETPQYSSVPILFGAHYDLNGNYSYIPTIQGDTHITSSYSNSYTLSEVPPGATVSWTLSLGLSNISLGTGSAKSISNVYSSLPYSSAVLGITTAYSGVTYSDSKNVGLWVPGNHSDSHLISAYAGEFMLWENIPGITNYSWGTDDPNLNITQQGFFIAPYEMNPGTDPAYEYVWVSFNNPLGELTTIIEQNNAH